MTKRKIALTIIAFLAFSLNFMACHSGSSQLAENKTTDTAIVAKPGTDNNSVKASEAGNLTGENTDKAVPVKAGLTTVLIYNFHVTNRCASCIAVEDATTKTINTYFANEVRQGRIKRMVLNVDDNSNKAICEKYQAFGSGLYITRVFNGKETMVDLTSDGFKYAKNKEDQFIEILKNQIAEYLK